MSIFSRWQPAAILDLIWITLDCPRSAIVGLRLIPTVPIRTKICMVGSLPDESRVQSFKLKFVGVTILQGVEFPIFLLIFDCAACDGATMTIKGSLQVSIHASKFDAHFRIFGGQKGVIVSS